MNKVMTAALVAGGLMLLNSPEASAHKEVRYSYQPPPNYYYYPGIEERRSKHMPSWLKRNDAFRHWYKRTSLRQDRRLAWSELFNIYRWEYRRGDRYDRRFRYDDHYRDKKRRDKRRNGRRHRH